MKFSVYLYLQNNSKYLYGCSNELFDTVLPLFNVEAGTVKESREERDNYCFVDYTCTTKEGIKIVLHFSDRKRENNYIEFQSLDYVYDGCFYSVRVNGTGIFVYTYNKDAVDYVLKNNNEIKEVTKVSQFDKFGLCSECNVPIEYSMITKRLENDESTNVFEVIQKIVQKAKNDSEKKPRSRA